jgi:autotransporter-associated beta strand protein
MKKTFTLKLPFLAGLTTIVCAFGLHAADLTWDADPTTGGIQDGANAWNLTTNTWWDGANNVLWDNSTPANAIFGGSAVSGTAGPVTVGAGLTINIGNLTFNTPFAGNYNLTPGDANSRLSFSPSSVVTVGSGLTITNTVLLTGSSSFTKAGPGTFWIRPGSINLVSIGATVVTDGTLVMGSTGNRVVIPGDLLVTNTGDARLGAANVITNIATVTVASSATFEMNGNALAVSNFVLNGGNVIQTSTEALQPTTMDARSGSISQNGGTGKFDVGTLTKSTAGTVTLTSRASSATTGGLTNTIVNAGTLILDYIQSASKFNKAGTLTVNGGTLLFTNYTSEDSVGSFILNGGVLTNVSGTIDLSVPSAGGIFDVRTGTVYMVLGKSSQSLVKSTPGLVILAGDNTYSGGTTINGGTLQLGVGGTNGLAGSASANITNNGTLIFNRGNVVLGTPLNFSGVISGSGSIIQMGSGIIGLTASSPTNSYTGSTTISNGTINLSATSTLGDGTGTLFLSGGTLSSTANRTPSTAPVPNPVVVTANSAITTVSTAATVDFNLNNNSISGTGGSLTFSNAAPSAAGVFEPRFSGSGFNFSQPIVVANGGFGTTRLDSFNTNGTTQTFSGAISGSGGYRRNASVAGTGGTTILAGINTYTGPTDVTRGLLLVNGSIGTNIVTVALDGTLGGNGTVNGAVTNNGKLSPGASIGILTISNSLTFGSGGTCFMELNKSTPTNDLVRGITTVTYGGTLVVTNLAGTLALNDTFKLFDATTYTGSFATTNLPALDPSLAWDTTGLTVNGTIKVVTATVTSPVLGYAQTNNVSTFSWTGSFKLQSQTNTLNTGLYTNWVDYPGGGTSPVTVTNDPASPSVFFRLSQ